MHGFGGLAPVSRAVLLAVLALLLTAPLAQAAPWLQPRGDAAATGFQPDEGPAWPDVALRVEMPDPFAQTFAPPLILDDRVLMLVSPHDAPLTFTGPWRVLSLDLATGELSTVTELPPGEGPSYGTFWDKGAPGGLATDGGTVYVAGNHSVHAVPLEPGGYEWTRHLGSVEEDGRAEPCGHLRLQADHLTVLCTETDPEGAGSAEQRPLTLVARLDVATGEPVWTWTHPGPVGSGPQAPSVPPPDEPRPPVLGSQPVGLAVSGPLVVVQTWDAQAAEDATSASSPAETRAAVRGLEAATGTELWRWVGDPVALAEVFTPATGIGESPRILQGNPTLSEQAVFVKTNALHKLAIGNGDQQWSRQIGAEDIQEGYYDPGVGLAQGKAYVMSGQTLYQVDAEDPSAGWTTTLNQTRDQFFYWDPIVTPSTLYTGGSLPDGSPGPLYAFDVDTGERLWTQPAEAPAGFAVGQGLLVYGEHTDREGQGSEHASDDHIVVLGRTPTSPTPSAQASSMYPAVGATVEVDLSGSGDGLQGPVTKYMATWGDGTTTNWKNDSVLTHSYPEPGNHTARFIVGNDANQTNSTTMTFHVGGSPPAEPTFLQTAFARENQAVTFGVLGLGLLLVGIVALVVLTRRRAADEADRLEAYERVVATEIAEGRADEDLTRRMAPMRAALGVSEKEHARIVETLMARRTGTSVALVPGEAFLDRYEVLERLGGGSGGTAYLCHDQRIDREVVIKALHATEQDVEATVREARAFGAVNHENVVSLHDVEQVGDRVFLVLEHVPGGGLDETEEPPDVDRLAEDLLTGLQAVHDAGIVHRDVKPSNLLVTEEGRYKLADFGIAHTPGFQTSIGGLGGGAVGTVQYMSPEQAKGREVDHRSDLYSAAVVLLEAFTGEPYMAPEPGETATELQMRIAQADGLPRVPGEASKEVQGWFERALDPDPEARFETSEEMLEAFPTGG